MNPTHETYQELQVAYEAFNKSLFGNLLPSCLITLQREKNTCGYFSASRFANLNGQVTDEIAINPSFFGVTPLIEIMQTLVHEMTHLWQYHFGDPGRGRYHNKEWSNKMESIGLMPSSTGRPGGKRTGDQIADYAIEGGAFLSACRELLTNEFKLTWYDRFPPSAVARSGQNSFACQLNGLPESGTNIILEDEGSQMIVASEYPRPIESQNKQTRVKYSCSCGINIWAKPNIRVRCCECDIEFEPIVL
jgi:predicted SprT family Zn-dependent metalloprotease